MGMGMGMGMLGSSVGNKVGKGDALNVRLMGGTDPEKGQRRQMGQQEYEHEQRELQQRQQQWRQQQGEQHQQQQWQEQHEMQEVQQQRQQREQNRMSRASSEGEDLHALPRKQLPQQRPQQALSGLTTQRVSLNEEPKYDEDV